MPTLRELLTRELEKIPGLEKKMLAGNNGGFTYFSYKGKEIAHFDNNNELDVLLTKKIIKQEGLEHPKDSKNHPNRIRSQPHWIVLQIRSASSIKEIVRLVLLATKQL